WTKAEELIIDPAKPMPKLGGIVPDGYHMAFADYSVDFIPHKTSETLVRSLVLRDVKANIGRAELHAALKNMGQERRVAGLTIKEWTARLRAPKHEERLGAHRALADAGADAKEAIPILVEEARTDPKYRPAAGETLARLGAAPEVAIPILLENLVSGERDSD